jgi:hypothetical protein
MLESALSCNPTNTTETNMIPGKVLYWGDNGVHEFWESEDHELLILRNHGESQWTAHRNYGFLFGCRSETEAASRLKVQLSRSHVWIRENGKLVLEVCAEARQASLGLELFSTKLDQD